MKPILILSTNLFWEKMCDARFIRLDLYSGKIDNIYFLTSCPPELIQGFLSQIVAVVTESLTEKVTFK